ncbi:MAG: hypothetical protein ACK55Z_25635, partial [bacterium]
AAAFSASRSLALVIIAPSSVSGMDVSLPARRAISSLVFVTISSTSGSGRPTVAFNDVRSAFNCLTAVLAPSSPFFAAARSRARSVL